jgi:hypothetical protein
MKCLTCLFYVITIPDFFINEPFITCVYMHQYIIMYSVAMVTTCLQKKNVV